jgi:hypothetical protein
MKSNKSGYALFLLAMVALSSGVAHAGPLPTVSATGCPDEIAGDVTAVAVPSGTTSATACYGLFDGNTPDGSLTITGIGTFAFLGKHDRDENEFTFASGFDGFTANFGSGTFSFDAGPVTFDGDWVIAVKQASCFGAWTFGAGTYSGGNFEGNWTSAGGGKDAGCELDESVGSRISHLSLYGPTPTSVPEPGALALLGLGLLGLVAVRRRMSTR